MQLNIYGVMLNLKLNLTLLCDLFMCIYRSYSFCWSAAFLQEKKGLSTFLPTQISQTDSLRRWMSHQDSADQRGTSSFISTPANCQIRHTARGLKGALLFMVT